jgi:hypothetical protein
MAARAKAKPTHKVAAKRACKCHTVKAKKKAADAKRQKVAAKKKAAAAKPEKCRC